MDEGLKLYLKDNCQAWDMSLEGNYTRKKSRRGAVHNAQTTLLETLALSQ